MKKENKFSFRKVRIKVRNKSGQILVLVLLVVVVSLAVGLAVASRNLTNLRTSTQAEQSQRAFTAAEGGVENTLSNLNNVAKAVTPTGVAGDAGSNCPNAIKPSSDSLTCDLPASLTTSSGVSATNSKVTIKANKSYEKTVQLGDVAQINLLSYASDIIVEWAKIGEPAQVSLEFMVICDKSSAVVCPLQVDGSPISPPPPKPANAYGQARIAFTSDTSTFGQSAGFAQCGLPDAGSLFRCKTKLSQPDANALVLRIKPFWDQVTVKVTAQGAGFPVQTYEITSTATTDSGLSRKVQVTRDALPQLPAIFDYVLYSGQDIVK